MTDKSLRLTPVYDLLLRGTPTMPVGLYHLHLATCEQLTRLHYRAGTRKTVGKRLKTLVDHGYLQADSLPTRRLKSPYSYSLATKGIRYLAGLGLDIPDRPRKQGGRPALPLRRPRARTQRHPDRRPAPQADGSALLPGALPPRAQPQAHALSGVAGR